MQNYCRHTTARNTQKWDFFFRFIPNSNDPKVLKVLNDLKVPITANKC